jgi:hypothetical protein
VGLFAPPCRPAGFWLLLFERGRNPPAEEVGDAGRGAELIEVAARDF